MQYNSYSHGIDGMNNLKVIPSTWEHKGEAIGTCENPISYKKGEHMQVLESV